MLLHRQQNALPSLDLALAINGAFPASVTFTRASTATFVGSNGLIQTAPSGQARFGYDPVTLAPLGYLSEEQRTNLILRSGDISNAAWVQTVSGSGTLSVTANSAVAPDGTTTAAKITINRSSTSDNARVSQTFTGTAAVYAGSLYVKADGAGAIGKVINFTLNDGGAVQGLISVTLTAAWQRVATTGTLTASASCAIWFGYIGSAGAQTGSVSFDAWGGQSELTSTNYPGPTSYIPTAGSTVTRAADVATMTGANFSSWYNQAAGTFVTQQTPPGDYNQLGIVLDAEQDGANWSAVILKSDSASTAAGKRWSAYTDTGGVFVAQIAQGSNGAAVLAKLAYAYATNDFALAADAVLVGTDASGALSTPIKLDIGSFRGSSAWFNGHIASIRYYRQRLPNTTLQALTT